jgi:hypothetical protein
MGQHPRLAAAGAGEYQDRARLGTDRFALAIIQGID